MTRWDFQNKGKSRWTGKSSFVLEVPLRHLRPSVIYSVPCDWILQRAYYVLWLATWAGRWHYPSNSDYLLCMFMDLDSISVHKDAEKNDANIIHLDLMIDQ